MNLFNEDNIVNIALNKVGDIIVCNLLFVLCSIPLVTIGPSMTALYHCMLRSVKGNLNGAAKTFFRSFKENFFQSLAAWLLFLFLLFILLLNIRFLSSQNTGVSQPLLYLSEGAAVLLVIGGLYIFPVIAAFSNTLKNLVKNSYIFAFMHFPSTLLLAVITILPMFMTYQDLTLLPLYACCWFFFGFGLTALINAHILYRFFKNYLGDENPPQEKALSEKIQEKDG
ncbi:MAG TPA: DUF624 domain-containing protein [Candidatus Eubacterium avistercoris]|uniref:DUF624 domain-containing protein n=1 Tax=Candidatus Eubacterium avistercoris TaxID=2838567 RepID=A0A9D2D2J0_9FIRM|nr:DUF624 domain-containing protein [Candidatus Eubacterium avistercoris]